VDKEAKEVDMEIIAVAAEWEEETVTNPPADTEDPTIPVTPHQEAAPEATAAVEWEEETTINPQVDTEDPMTPATTLVDRAAVWEAACLADNLEASQAAPAAWSLGLSRRECRPLRDLPRRRVGKYHLLS